MPLRDQVSNRIGDDLFSIQQYPSDYFEAFNPDKEFEKWAAVEVTEYSDIPAHLEHLDIPGGDYAVFIYKGNPSASANFFNDIFSKWLPNGGYKPDNRPHFEILGEKYQNNSPDSEEEVWIPVIKI